MNSQVSKAAYARHRGVSPAAISNFIARGRLTAPALTRDGLIDLPLADQQLGVTVDPVMSASARSRQRLPSNATVDASYSSRLIEARAISAEIRAERDRRELEAERGKYCLTAKAEAVWRKLLTDMLQSIEQEFFGDLVDTLGLNGLQRVALRKCWHKWRSKQAQDARARAATLPEFEEDPEAPWGKDRA